MVIADGVHERRHPGQVHGVHLRPVLEEVLQDLSYRVVPFCVRTMSR